MQFLKKQLVWVFLLGMFGVSFDAMCMLVVNKSQYHTMGGDVYNGVRVAIDTNQCSRDGLEKARQGRLPDGYSVFPCDKSIPWISDEFDSEASQWFSVVEYHNIPADATRLEIGRAHV